MEGERLLAKQGVFSDQGRPGPSQVCYGVHEEWACGWSSETYEAMIESGDEAAEQLVHTFANVL